MSHALTCLHPHPHRLRFQLWLDNRSTMSAIHSLYSRLAAAFSGLRNAFFGQTRSRARLNVIASYDQSNELFKVRAPPFFGLSFLG